MVCVCVCVERGGGGQEPPDPPPGPVTGNRQNQMKTYLKHFQYVSKL